MRSDSSQLLQGAARQKAEPHRGADDGGDEERLLTRGLEIARGGWRKYIVRFGIHIIEVAKNPQLIIADFVLERRIPAPALLLRIRARIEVKVKSGKQTAEARNPPDKLFRVIKIAACRKKSVSAVRRTSSYESPWV